MPGLVIINADDWGGFADGTDAILSAFAAGSITSTTAMVHMADSRRAAELALEHALPVGLHLNLTQPFDAPEVPQDVRERQRRVCEDVRPLSLIRRWSYDPRPSTDRLIRAAIADQLEAFRSLYRKEPTHVDSHQHAHGSPDVFMRLPKSLPARRTASMRAHVIARRLRTTERFHSISHLVPELGGTGIESALRAPSDSIEIMVHPSFPRELPILVGRRWLQSLEGVHLGTFAEIQSGLPSPI